MNKKNFFRTVGKAMATMLFAATVLTGFNSCVANEDNAVDTTPQPGGEVTEPYVEPTDDQLEVKVTTDMPTAVLSQFDENSVGAALVKRLSQTTNAIDDNTKLVLIDGNHTEMLTEDYFYKLARIYMNGGYIALQRPTLGVALAVALGLKGKVEEVRNDNLKENGVEMSEAAAAASTRSSIGDQLMRKINNARALTRGEDDDPNPVIAELLIFTPDASYLRPPYNEEETVASHVVDENGQETTVEQKVENIQNPYRYGCMADGAASWLNSMEQQIQDAQQPAATRALTRADGEQVINSIMSATDVFTFDGELYFFDSKGRLEWYPSGSKFTIRSWSVHDFSANKDYYYVEEECNYRLGGQRKDKTKTIYWGPYNEGWLTDGTEEYWYFQGYIITTKTKGFKVQGHEKEGFYSHYYGSWLSKAIHRLDLTGAGEIKVEQSLPATDNNNVSQTIAIGQTDGTSKTTGFSIGGGVNGGGGKSGDNGTGQVNGGVNFSFSWSTTEIHQTSITMSTTHFSKELALRKNTDGTCVEWTYEEGLEPGFKSIGCQHEMAPDVLTNDLDLTNKVCWSVKNPEESYKLRLDYSNTTKVRLFRFADIAQLMKFESKCFDTETSNGRDFDLQAPPRNMQKWYCDISVNGQNLQYNAMNLFRQELQKDINATMFDNSFILAEATKDGVEIMSKNVDVATRILKDGSRTRKQIDHFAESLGIEKYIIEWYSMDEGLEEKTFKKAYKIAN